MTFTAFGPIAAVEASENPRSEEDGSETSDSPSDSEEAGSESSSGTPGDDSTAAAEEVPSLGDAVLVTGTRTRRSLSRSVVPANVLSAEEIEASGARTTADLLRSQPGVRVESSFAGDTVSIQGLGNEYVLLLVDGERMQGRVDGSIDLDRVPLESIERIEIVRGPGSALYGADALAGVVHIITKGSSPKPLNADLSFSYGSRHTVDLTGAVSGKWKFLSGRITGLWRRGDGYGFDKDSEATNGPAFQHFDVRGLVALEPTDRFRLEVRGNWRRGDDEGVDVTGSGATFDRRNLTEEHGVSLRPSFDWGEGSSVGTLDVTLGYLRWHDQYLSDQRGSDALDSFDRTIDDQVTVGAVWNQGTPIPLVMTSGGEVLIDRLQSDRLSEDGLRVRLGLYVQGEIDLAPGPTRLVLIPGFRFDLDSRFGVAPSPKIAVRFEPHPAVAIRGSWGLGYRAPSFKEMLLRFQNPAVGYVVDGNPDLRPERSSGGGAGVVIKPTPWLSWTLDVYRNDLQDMITVTTVATDSGPALFSYTNVAEAYTHGVNTELELRPTRWLGVSVGYDLGDGRNKENGLRLEARPVHRATAGIDLNRNPWGVIASVRFEVVGPRTFYGVDEQGDVAEDPSVPYVQLDARIAKRFGEHVDVFVGLEDVLIAAADDGPAFVGVDNAAVIGPPSRFPGTPWRVYGGVRLRY